MDREKEQEYAAQFRDADSCYIRAEMTGGVLELVCGGNQIALLYAASCIIDRVCETAGQQFEHALEAVKLLHDEPLDGNIVPFRGKH